MDDKNKRIGRFLHSLAATVVTVITALGSSLPIQTVQASDDATLVAPNLMIIFGNAYSMNRELDDQTYPDLDLDNDNSIHDDVYRFDDDAYKDNPVNGQSGQLFYSNLYGNIPTSKLYQSKMAFKSILADDALSGDINLGFATFRQTFGLRVSTDDVFWNKTWPEAYPHGGKPADAAINRNNPNNPSSHNAQFPNGNDIYTASTQDKDIFSRDPTNLSYIRWSGQWLPWESAASGSNSCAYPYTGAPRYGKPNGGSGYYESGRGVFDDASATYLSQKDGYGGLPLEFSLNTSSKDQAYSGTSCNGGSSNWPWAVQNTTRARSEAEAAAGTPVVRHRFCKVYYKSQQNKFEAFYTSDRVFKNSYPTKWNGYHIRFQSPGSYLYYDDGLMYDRDGTNRSETEYDTSCEVPPYTRKAMEKNVEVSHELRANGPYADNSGNVDAHFSLNAHFYEGEWNKTAGADRGALTGWSGETDYSYNHSDGSETLTATFPSGVADPCRSDRDLCPSTILEDDPDLLHRYVKTMGADKPENSRHMGVFLDLPDPGAGYIDNRPLLEGFMGYQQMDDSGLDYDPVEQVIADGKGVSTASLSWYAYQSPLYQSLFSAVAYFAAYKEADAYDDCGRSNNILLFYDGKEDGRWTNDSDGNKVYARPEEMAARLKDELGVNVYVIILSNNTGDIEQANLIASSGGTEEALAVDSIDALENALEDVFAVLKTKASRAPATIPPISQSEDLVFEVQDQYHPDFGQLVAYQLNDDGDITDSNDLAVTGDDSVLVPIWKVDDGTNMTVDLRKARLWSTLSSGELANFYSDLDDAAFSAGSNPDVSTIKEYTMNPSYSDGDYLGGRKSGSLIGLIGKTQPVAIERPKDSSLYEDESYRTFMTIHKSRNTQALFSSQDGFLYGVNATSGELEWGWMPRQFVSDLKDYRLFDDNAHFSGHFKSIDAKDSSGNYGTYIVGSAEGGKLHYSLKLDISEDDIDLASDSLVWDHYTSQGSPNNAEPVFWSGDNGITYVLYINGPENSSSAVRTLTIRDITDSTSTPVTFQLKESGGSNWQVSSSPFVVNEKDGNTYIYVGTVSGELHRLAWSGYASGNGGTLSVDDNFSTGMELGESDSVRHIGYAQYRGGEYLRLQSATRLTVLKRPNTSDDWTKNWSSYVGGADAYHLTPTATTSIQHLPSGGEITAEGLILLGSVVVPVYQTSAGENQCSSGVGALYFFDLEAGLFPNNRFILNDLKLVDLDYGEDDQLGSNNPVVIIGDGRSHRPQFSVFEGDMNIYGHTEESDFLSLKLNQSLTGARSWREIR